MEAAYTSITKLPIPAILTDTLNCRKCFISRSSPLLVQSDIFYQYLALNLRKYFLIAFTRKLSFMIKNTRRYESVLNIFEDTFLQLLNEQQNFSAPVNAFEECRDKIRSKYLFELFDKISEEEIRLAFIDACMEVGDFCYENMGSPKGCLHRYFEKRTSTNVLLGKLKSEYGTKVVLNFYPSMQQVLMSFSDQLDTIILRVDPTVPEGIPAHEGIGSSVLNYLSIPIKESEVELQARYERNRVHWQRETLTSFRTMVVQLKKESLIIVQAQPIFKRCLSFFRKRCDPLKLLEISLSNRSRTRTSALESIVNYCFHSEQDDFDSLDLFTEQLEFGITFNFPPEPVKLVERPHITLDTNKEEKIVIPTTSSISTSTFQSVPKISTSTSSRLPVDSVAAITEKQSGHKAKRKLRRQLEAAAKSQIEKLVVEDAVELVEKKLSEVEEEEVLLDKAMGLPVSSLSESLKSFSLDTDGQY